MGCQVTEWGDTKYGTHYDIVSLQHIPHTSYLTPVYPMRGRGRGRGRLSAHKLPAYRSVSWWPRASLPGLAKHGFQGGPNANFSNFSGQFLKKLGILTLVYKKIPAPGGGNLSGTIKHAGTWVCRLHVHHMTLASGIGRFWYIASGAER